MLLGSGRLGDLNFMAQTNTKNVFCIFTLASFLPVHMLWLRHPHSHLNPLSLVSFFPSDFSFWDSIWKMKLRKCICLLWKLYPCNHIIWNLRKQKKNPDFVHLTSSLSVTYLCFKQGRSPSFVVMLQGMPKEGEEKTWKKRKGKECTNTCMWQYLLLQDTPIPCEPEINPRALSVE